MHEAIVSVIESLRIAWINVPILPQLFAFEISGSPWRWRVRRPEEAELNEEQLHKHTRRSQVWFNFVQLNEESPQCNTYNDNVMCKGGCMTYLY